MSRTFYARSASGFTSRTSIKILKNWDVADEVLTALQEEESQAES